MPIYGLAYDGGPVVVLCAATGKPIRIVVSHQDEITDNPDDFGFFIEHLEESGTDYAKQEIN